MWYHKPGTTEGTVLVRCNFTVPVLVLEYTYSYTTSHVKAYTLPGTHTPVYILYVHTQYGTRYWSVPGTSIIYDNMTYIILYSEYLYCTWYHRSTSTLCSSTLNLEYVRMSKYSSLPGTTGPRTNSKFATCLWQSIGSPSIVICHSPWTPTSKLSKNSMKQ